MRINLPIIASLGACAAFVGSTAMAQAVVEEAACTKTRAEVKAECTQFLKTHVWDDGATNYVLKSGVRPPEGVPSRETIVAERNKFLSTNTWNDGKSMWVPISGKGRDIGTDPMACTRADVKADCAAFMKTYRWDEGKSSYVPIKK